MNDWLLGGLVLVGTLMAVGVGGVVSRILKGGGAKPAPKE